MVEQQSAALRFLYQTVPGRWLLRPLVSRSVSKAAGRFLDSRLSRPLIAPFVRKNGIDLSEFECNFNSFNDCFSRKIKAGRRPVVMDPQALIAPCDGLLSAFRVEKGTVLAVKQSRYTLDSLLGDPRLAENYQNGWCLVFRLCVQHYHRYCYVDGGHKGENVFLPGKLHTVRPIALAQRPVFIENCREYTVIDSPVFGPMVQMEVGAMLVGKIQNYAGSGTVVRGAEKGRFLYGGSTIIVLLKEAALRPDILKNSADGTETPVKLGERIGARE